MTTAWLIDGSTESTIPPTDRGLAYGDGLFETIAAPGGQPRHFDRHYARLRRSCERLALEVPSREAIEADIARLVTKSADCIIKIIVTRGSGGRGYRPPDDAVSVRMTGIFPWPQRDPRLSTEGVRMIRCATRLGENAALAGMKHLCRLEQVLAQREVAAADAHEGLMQSNSGDVIGGTMSNLFIVSGGVLHTPRVDLCGVAGVMRGLVIEQAVASGIAVDERRIGLPDLLSAEEVFLCNAVFGIWPVTVLDDVAFEVGKLTQSLQASPEIGLR